MKKEKKRLSAAKRYAIVLTAVILCCILLSVLDASYDWDWDITAGEFYTLSPQTLAVLGDVDDTISIYTLYSLGNYNKTILTLLEKYQFYCKNITVSNIDPMEEAQRLREIEGVEDTVGEGALVVREERSGRVRVIDAEELYMTYDGDTYFLAENRLTDAIQYVRTGEFRRLLLTVGHREAACEELEKFVKRMTMKNYIVEEYDYLHTTLVPDPATDILISVSPKEDLTENEAQSIRDFADAGGTYILLYDYAEYDEEQGVITYPEAQQMQLKNMMRRFGIELGTGMIVGQNAAQTGFRDTILEVTTDTGRKAVMSECTILKKTYSASYTAEPFVMTAEDCALELRSGGYRMEQAPFAVAMRAQGKNGGCVAAFATSSFLSDTELSAAENEELLDSVLQSMGTVQNSAPPKRASTDELAINSMLVKAALTVFALVLLPCGILALGIVTLRRRRMRAGEDA